MKIKLLIVFIGLLLGDCTYQVFAQQTPDWGEISDAIEQIKQHFGVEP